MKKLVINISLFLALASGGIVATAGSASASASVPAVQYTSTAGGNCYYSTSTDTLYSPGIKVYGLGPSADYVRVWSRLVTTNGSAVTTWVWDGDQLASSTAPALYSPVGLTMPIMSPLRNLQIQIEVVWYQQGSIYTWRTYNPVNQYTVHMGNWSGTASYCQA